MTAHEHADLCRSLRRPDASVESDIAADVIDHLHAQRADLLHRLDLAEQRIHLLQQIIDADRRSFARLAAPFLSPPAVAASSVGSPAAGDSSPTTPDEPGQE